MSLFPAYSESERLQDEVIKVKFDEITVPEAMEAELLDSDADEEYLPVKKQHYKLPQAEISSSDDFYFDSKLDCGNLRVSTLYYPGRPQYSYVSALSIGAKRRQKDESSRWRRYFSKHNIRIEQEATVNSSMIDRQKAYRKLLAETPNDLSLWEAYIDFQEVCDSVQSALDTAREACTQLPHSTSLRERMFTLMKAALPRRQYLEGIRDLLVKEKRASVRTWAWARLVREAEAAEGADAALAGALADTRPHPPAYPRLLLAYGEFLIAAGLWERLVLAVELLVALNFPSPPAPLFPPPHLPADEQRLQELEDKAISSGLPSSAVWVRVERARAAAHWRPAGAGAGTGCGADPQRAPLPHDVADLLVPLVGAPALAHLAVRLLLLAKVPLLPGTTWAARALGAAGAAGAGGEALLPLLAAARLLPPAHAARASALLDARLLRLLTDPPHYFADDTGFESWVRALWAAAGAHEALLCWRLRWLRARALLACRRDPEFARLRAEARSALKQFGASSPLAFAEFARLELQAEGGAAEGCGGEAAGPGGAGRALAAAAHALRAAIADEHRPTEHALYVAGVVCEVSAGSGECALVHAALRRPPPAPLAPPLPALRDAALLLCEERCEALERSFESGGVEEWEAAEGGPVEGVLGPGVEQWAAARVALAAPARRVHLLRDLLARAARVENGEGLALRYYEESACALVRACGVCGAAGALRAEHVAALARLYPDNAYLALVAAGVPAWRGASAGAARSPCGALARLLPPFYRALDTDFAPAEAERLARACRRAARASGGAALGAAGWAARLEAEARAPRPRLPAALYHALDAHPAHKWLHVRGAAWCGGEAGALADALLERALRLHAHPLELPYNKS